ncbi:MAG: poly-beta-1,6 N-acetyl-D-glucosamine export porin PgaA [Lysobacterales bacterium RIFOXYD1_FULL_69_11]|nr:MAG: poly-beta-1,6 N-acetyl-D-glucosamine export porin PgaA [Xanthomonadales bacterium RIFOXYA1_FULL_69_10]OHE88156.1 MAG: poly-beta-1,6 N-acetyl-D-glucosamine export porin PgaA [Xanthomonadales bacterium RIFOXYD1_FULL_69_11]
MARGNEPVAPPPPDTARLSAASVSTMPRGEAMVEAWRLRDEGRWLETLAISEVLLERDPADDDAFRLRTLALSDLGASHRAWELYQARPHLFEPVIARRLQADRVARMIVWGGLHPVSPESRLTEMQAAQTALAGLTANLAATDDAAVSRQRMANDELIALNTLGRHEAVSERYRQSVADGVELPAYVGAAVGDSLLSARHPELAVDALEATVRDDPEAHEARILLVYAYVESERFDDAYALLESMQASEAPWLSRAGARQEYANWRRYDIDVTQVLVDSFAHALEDAQRQAESLVSVGAMNANLHQTLGSVYLQRGWAERGLERHRVARTLDPDDAAPRVGEVQALLDLDRTAQARPLLADLMGLHPENLHAQRVQQRWERRQGWQITHESSWGRNNDDDAASATGGSPLGSRDTRHVLRVASPLLGDRWRLTAHASRATADFLGERVDHTLVGAGVSYAQDRLQWGAEAATPSDDYDDGTTVGAWGRWRFSDVLAGTASYHLNDPLASLQARRTGITADAARVRLDYTPSESTTVQAGLEQLRYEDGNRRESASLLFDQRLASRPHFLLNGFGGVQAGRGSREDAPYFNPTRDTSLELGLRADHIAWRRYDRHFRHRLAVSAVNYRQEGFGAEWYPQVRYEHEWQLAAGRQIGYGVGYSRPVYDGVREDRVSFDLRVAWGE